ncbi:MAG: FHA domain-containing protein [Chloroflexi bacterium]|nr:FHA domain-containing protein [Chloroflexota bacterium]
MRRLFRLLLSLSLIAGAWTRVHAQTAAYAEIVRVDASNFPQISALVDVFDANGQFISGLEPSDIIVYEDGQERTAATMRQSVVPVQVAVAVNPGPALAIRDQNAVSRFEKVVQALRQWAEAQPVESQDDLSLVSLSGSLINHAGVHDWFVSLESFKPDFRNSVPNLQTLAIALDTVSAPTPQPGMKRAVLFITPHMDDPNIDNTIAPLIQRAVDAKIRVFVWLIDAEEFNVSPSANAFKLLAQQTDGAFFSFSRDEPFPDPGLYFLPLRNIYEIAYTSALTTPGDHTLGLYVQAQGASIPALNKTFNVNVQPPNPIFVSPPLQITRRPPADDPYNAEVLEPSQQIIEIIVEFPDGHKRDLKRTTLYMDGQIVAENTEKPFESFLWEYSGVTESGQHQIVVEAEDILGLKKSSIGIPVTFTVIHPPGGFEVFLMRYSSQLTLGALIFAGFALLVILTRSRTNIPESRRRRARRSMEDPLTQPVAALTEPPISAKNNAKSQPRFGWMGSTKNRLPPAPAYLIRLRNGGEPASAAPIPVSEKETTFGTDPVQAMYVLDDPSIAPLHARIQQTGDGHFLIMDLGSVAGTWVNYEAVTRDGMPLKHGDRIHFGRLQYRFDLRQPPAEPAPKVVSLS